MSLLTMRGMYKYDPGIFDGLNIPDFWEKETLIECILERCEEREVLYAQPVTMAGHIRHWAKSNYKNWQRLAEALQVDYDPLENFDRREETTDKSSGKTSSNSKASATTKATGFNSGALQTTGGDDTEGQTSGEQSVENTHTGRLHGNIGVTTSQQMLQSEIDLRRWNWYYEVADDFRERFTLGVW